MAIRINLRRRAEVWHHTYATLLEIGFSDEEARWAADRNFDLTESVMDRIIEKRQRDIKNYIRIWNLPWDGAVTKLSRQNQLRNIYHGESAENEFNLIRLISPGKKSE